MPDYGLRDWLQNMQVAEQMSGDFANSAAALRSQIDKKQAQEQLAGAVNSKDMGQLAQIQSKINPQGLGDVLKTIINRQPAMNEQQVKTLMPNAPQEQVALAASQPTLETQQAVIHQLNTNASQAMQQRSQKRLEQGQTFSELKDFRNNFEKIESPIIDEGRQLNKVLAAAKRGTQPDYAIVFNYIARHEAGEKGPLSEGDIQRIKNEVFQGKEQAWANFATGETKPQMSDQQIKTFNDILAASKVNFDQYKSYRVAQALNRSNFGPQLFEESGAPVKPIMDIAKDYGLTYQNGKFSPPTVKKEIGSGEDLSSAKSLIDQIQDPETKQNALRTLQSFEGKNLAGPNGQKLKQFIQALQGHTNG